jgi:hypothetical protein
MANNRAGHPCSICNAKGWLHNRFANAVRMPSLKNFELYVNMYNREMQKKQGLRCEKFKGGMK